MVCVQITENIQIVQLQRAELVDAGGVCWPLWTRMSHGYISRVQNVHYIQSYFYLKNINIGNSCEKLQLRCLNG